MSETFSLPVTFTDSTGEPIAVLEEGGAETKAGRRAVTLRLFQGDLINVRNIQGGTVDTHNLDISAGGDGGEGNDPRGDVIFQNDNGNATRFFDGRKRELFAINPRNDKRLHSRVPHRFHAGAYVPAPGGGWRRL